MTNLQKKIQFLLNLYKEKRLAKAESFGKELIGYYPNAVILYNLLGLILTDQQKIDEAIDCYEKGIRIKPDYAMIYNNLGSIYQSKENYLKAENYYKKSINLDSKIPEPQNNLGNLYLFLNRYSEAIDCYNKAINIKPRFAVFHYNLGIAYKNIGELTKAKKHLKEAVKLNKYFCIAHRNLGLLIKYSKNDDHFGLLKALYKDSKINTIQKTELAFALGKACDDIKDYDEAFQYYREGNKLRRKSISFSINDEKKEFNKIKEIFNKNFFNKFAKSGDLDGTSIFILGMPRSGTTLIEQILSSHPNVYGGGELNFLPDLIKKHFSDGATEFTFESILNVDKENLKKIGQKYINNLKNISNNSDRVTDKLPINFKWIGLIKLILPNSKIIHCVRNSRDNCLSVFKNYFVNPRLNFAYHLEEISDFYILYDDLMKYWKSILPNFIFDIKYEKMIQNPEEQIRSLLKTCNLSWDDNCLEFYNNKRPIKTASDLQVRKKIYKTSINTWKNHEKDLKKVFHKLSNL